MTEFIQSVTNLIRGIRTLAVPRIEDLPYASSPPIQYVYESTAVLSLGMYVWDDAPSSLTPDRPVLAKAIYFFRNLSLTADAEELDYTSALVTTPQFFMFKQADAKAVLFREPIVMNKFFDQFDYRLAWWSEQEDDQLFGAFRGSLLQTPALIGKTNITLKAVITAQEIADDSFVKHFKSGYPVSK